MSFQELVLSFESRGHKSVGMDQTKGFDTCIDQDSWNQQAIIRRLGKLREGELSQA